MTDEERKQVIHDYMSSKAKLRWEKMSDEERRAYAKKLAKARWAKTTPEERKQNCKSSLGKERKAE